jgi:hypothetical protein
MTQRSINDGPDMTGWTPADLKEYEDAQALLAAEEVKAQALSDAEAKRIKSASYQAQILRERAEEVRVARAEKERELEGQRELIRAQKAHGTDRVDMIPTLLGPIVLRAPTANEQDKHDLLLESLSGGLTRDKAWKAFTATLVVYPKADVFAKIVAEYPGTWPLLGATRDLLSSAARTETAKKG